MTREDEAPTPAIAVEVRGAGRWQATWPRLLAVLIVVAVAVPAAIASYRHAATVAERAGEIGMAAWLPLSVDGLLLAALVVIWVRRWTCERIGRWPWVAYWVGMMATVAANLAASNRDLTSYMVAIWPPCAVMITLELVALIVTPARQLAVRLTDQEIEEIEEVTGVPVVQEDEPGAAATLYRLYGASDELLYIGVTSDPKRHLAEHARNKPWWPEVARTVVRGYPTRLQALAVEEYSISEEGPLYNRSKGGLVDAHARRTEAAVIGQTDDDLRAQIRAWAKEEGGAVPSRERVRLRYGIGTGRSDRLRTAVIDDLAAGQGA